MTLPSTVQQIKDANAHPEAFKAQTVGKVADHVAELIPGPGHGLVIDSGWRDVADTALNFVQRFA